MYHIYLSAEHELFKESLEHVDERLAVFFVTLQVLGNEQNQLRKEGEREGRDRESVADEISVPASLLACQGSLTEPCSQVHYCPLDLEERIKILRC